MCESSENLLDIADPDINHFGETVIDFSTYTIEELKNVNISGIGNLNIIHHNCRSLLTEGKTENYDLIFDAMNNPFHILGFTETWLNVENHSDAHFDDFEHVYNLRNVDGHFDMKDRGGGLLLFIRNHLSFKIRDDLNRMLPFIETLFIEIQYKNKSYIVGVVYRTPNTNIELFTDEIYKIIEPI